MPKKYDNRPSFEFEVKGNIVQAQRGFRDDRLPIAEGDRGDNVTSLPRTNLSVVRETVYFFRLLEKARYLDRFNGRGHQMAIAQASLSGPLIKDIRRSYILAAVQAYEGSVSYSSVKGNVEMLAQCFNRKDFDAGKLDVDSELEAAVAERKIRSVEGGYAITPAGIKQSQRIAHLLFDKIS